jgi:hypothetical protein
MELHQAWIINEFVISAQGLFWEWWASESAADLPRE